MSNSSPRSGPKLKSAERRRQRLALALRDNLAKRKSQMRARAAIEASMDEPAHTPQPQSAAETSASAAK